MQSISVPQGPRNPHGYDRDDILRALRGIDGTRQWSFRYELLDNNNNKIMDLDNVKSCTVSQNFLATIKRTATFEIESRGEIDYLNDRIKPWARLHMPPLRIEYPGQIVPEADEPPSLGAFSDDFSEAPGDTWFYDTGARNLSGRLVIDNDSFQGPDGTYAQTQQQFSFRDTEVAAELVGVPSAGGGSDVWSTMSLLSTGSDELTIRYNAIDDTLEFDNGTTASTAAYDPVADRWLRLRESQNVVFWETSPDGKEWTPRRWDFTPAWIDTDAESLSFEFRSARDAGLKDATRWDNLNLIPDQNPYPRRDQELIWRNTFNNTGGATGELTLGSSNQSGNELLTASGTLLYSTQHTADNVNSVQIGADDGSEEGSFSIEVPFETPDEDLVIWSFRTYMYVPSGGYINIFPATNEFDEEFQCKFDDTFGAWQLGTIDISTLEAILTDKLMRFEMETNRNETAYRLFWSDPFGMVPDFETVQRTPDRMPNKGFAMSGGGFSRDPSFMDNMRIAKPGDYSSFTDPETSYVEWPLGVFLLSSPTRDADENEVVTRRIEGYDAAKVFQDDKLEDRFVLPKGDSYIDAINDFLGDIPKIVEPDDTVAGSDREWPIGTEVENVINDMTQAINYESLTFDEDGRAIMRPYILPDERSPEFAYADNEVSIMHPEVTQELDLFDVANKWVLYASNPEQEPVKAVLTNNDPGDPTSTVRRQRTIVDFREEEEVTDYASLLRSAQRIAFEASRQFEAVDFSTALMPIHSFNDMYTIQFSPLALDERYTEHKWEMPLEPGARMTHRARRIVRLDSELDTSFIDDDVTISGTLEADNFDYGEIAVTPRANRATMELVTGLDLKGSGRIHVFLTPHSAVPGQTFMETTVFGESNTGFEVWVYRQNDTSTNIHWFAYREP